MKFAADQIYWDKKCFQNINRLHVTLFAVSNIMTTSFCLFLHITVTYMHITQRMQLHDIVSKILK